MNHAPPEHHANHNHNNANPVAAAEPRQPHNPNHPMNQNEGDHQLIRGGGMLEQNGHATHNNNNNGSHHSHMMSGCSPTTTPPGPLLRCIIAKRFSNEVRKIKCIHVLLWNGLDLIFGTIIHSHIIWLLNNHVPIHLRQYYGI
jgi:hypothetical protein